MILTLIMYIMLLVCGSPKAWGVCVRVFGDGGCGGWQETLVTQVWSVTVGCSFVECHPLCIQWRGACVKVLIKQDWWSWWHLMSSTERSARQTTTHPIIRGKQSLLTLDFKTLLKLPLLLFPSLDMFWSSSLTLWFPSWGSWLLNGMLQNTAVPTGGIWPEHIINPLLFSLKGNFSLNSY